VTSRGSSCESSAKVPKTRTHNNASVLEAELVATCNHGAGKEKNVPTGKVDTKRPVRNGRQGLGTRDEFYTLAMKFNSGREFSLDKGLEAP